MLILCSQCGFAGWAPSLSFMWVKIRMCQTLGMRTCCLALQGNFLSSPSSLQMASNCFLNDLSVQAAGTWSERPFHIFISLWMRTDYIKLPFTFSKELSVQKKWWSWWTVSCGHKSPIRFFFSRMQVGVFGRDRCGPITSWPFLEGVLGRTEWHPPSFCFAGHPGMINTVHRWRELNYYFLEFLSFCRLRLFTVKRMRGF